MKRLLPFLLLLPGCTQQPIDLSDSSRMEIIQADTAMSALASKEGFNKALLTFADDSLIKPEEGRFPVLGKASLIEHWKGKEDTKGISWKPYRAEAARSGEMGFTFGNWIYVTPDTSLHGVYYTMWKRQPDGSWKWTVDGGNNTPAPKE